MDTHLKRKNKELSPRLKALYALIESGPKTAQQLAEGLGLQGPRAVPNVRTYLSQLASRVPILVNFAYGASTYELEKKSSHEAQ